MWWDAVQNSFAWPFAKTAGHPWASKQFRYPLARNVKPASRSTGGSSVICILRARKSWRTTTIKRGEGLPSSASKVQLTLAEAALGSSTCALAPLDVERRHHRTDQLFCFGIGARFWVLPPSSSSRIIPFRLFWASFHFQGVVENF